MKNIEKIEKLIETSNQDKHNHWSGWQLTIIKTVDGEEKKCELRIENNKVQLILSEEKRIIDDIERFISNTLLECKTTLKKDEEIRLINKTFMWFDNIKEIIKDIENANNISLSQEKTELLKLAQKNKKLYKKFRKEYEEDKYKKINTNLKNEIMELICDLEKILYKISELVQSKYTQLEFNNIKIFSLTGMPVKELDWLKLLPWVSDIKDIKIKLIQLQVLNCLPDALKALKYKNLILRLMKDEIPELSKLKDVKINEFILNSDTNSKWFKDNSITLSKNLQNLNIKSLYINYPISITRTKLKGIEIIGKMNRLEKLVIKNCDCDIDSFPIEFTKLNNLVYLSLKWTNILKNSETKAKFSVDKNMKDSNTSYNEKEILKDMGPNNEDIEIDTTWKKIKISVV